MSKKNILIIAICAVLILTTGICVAVSGVLDPYEQQIKLGYKLISEGKYEEAILAFDKAISIDVKREKAYIGKADTFVTRLDENALTDTMAVLEQGYKQRNNDEKFVLAFMRLADGLFDNSHEKWAIDLLTFGYELTHDERIKDKKSELVNKMAESILKGLYGMFENNDNEAVKKEIQSEKYANLMSVVNEDYKLIYFPNNSEDQSGKGIAIYFVNSETYGSIFVYFGDYQNGTRSGDGTWVGSKEGKYYWFQGKWVDDLPNGYGDVREWNEHLDEKVTVRHLYGNISNGLWDGDMVWEFINSDAVENWNVSFANGVVNAIEIDKEGKKVWSKNNKTSLVSKTKDENDKIIGVVGFCDNDV